MLYGNLLAFYLGPSEMIVILVLGLLIFGSRLPEVGKSLGKGFIEFKKGLRDIQDEINQAEYESNQANSEYDPYPENDYLSGEPDYNAGDYDSNYEQEKYDENPSGEYGDQYGMEGTDDEYYQTATDNPESPIDEESGVSGEDEKAQEETTDESIDPKRT